MFDRLHYVLVVVAMGAFALLTPIVAAEVELSVDLDRTVQDNFLGVNGVQSSYLYMPVNTSRGVTPELRNQAYDRLGAMGIRIVRAGINTFWIARDRWDPAHFDFESEQMKWFYAFCHDMKKRDIDVWVFIGWWIQGSENFNDGLDPAHRDKDDWQYNTSTRAEMTSEAIHQIISVHGCTNVKYLSYAVEPAIRTDDAGVSNAWKPDGMSSYELWRKTITAIHERLEKDGRRKLVKLVGPNNGHGSGGDILATAAKDLAGSVLDILSSHGYPLASGTGAVPLARKHGVEWWSDEGGWGTGKSNPPLGTAMGRAAIEILNNGAQSWFKWGTVEHQYPHFFFRNYAKDPEGIMDEAPMYWGDLPVPYKSTVPYASYYATALITKYIGGGSGTKVLLAPGHECRIAAVQRPDGNYSFLLVNERVIDMDYTVHLNRPLGRTLYRYLYDPAGVVPTATATIPGHSDSIEGVQESFRCTLPPGAVAIYSTIDGNGADVPVAPSNLTATVASSGSAELSWTDNSDNELEFHLQRNSEGRMWTTVAVVKSGTRTCVDTRLLRGTTYAYRVMACNNDGSSRFSGEANLVTPEAAKGPISHWRCDVIVGTSVADSAGTNHGKILGSPVIVPGKIGGALEFAAEGQRVAIGPEIYQNVLQDFTVAFWAAPAVERVRTQQSGTGYAGVKGQCMALDTTHGNVYGPQDVGVGVSVGTNGISVVEHGNNHAPTVIAYDAALGSDWTHIAVTYQMGEPKLYVNGVLVQTGVPSGRIAHPGASLSGGAFGSFIGRLDDVRIYERTLTAEDVNALYKSSE